MVVPVRFDLPSLIDPVLYDHVEATAAFYANRPARRGPSGLDELLAVRAAAVSPAESDPRPELVFAEAGGRSVPVRIHRPAGANPSGVLLEIHGGGFYLGSAAASDVRNRRIADALGIAVVSVDHRLSPDHPWPAAPDDCETAARWLADNAQRLFGTWRLAVTGFSSGATLAIGTLLRMRDSGIDAFSGGVLEFGTYDLAAQTPAGRLIADEYFLEAYGGTAPDRTDPGFSPLFAELPGLPPILIVIGEDDLLLHDNLAMAARLSAAGVTIDLRIYPASPHGFSGHPTPMGAAAVAHIDDWLRERFSED